jgi:hypothetical protein
MAARQLDENSRCLNIKCDVNKSIYTFASLSIPASTIVGFRLDSVIWGLEAEKSTLAASCFAALSSARVDPSRAT